MNIRIHLFQDDHSIDKPNRLVLGPKVNHPHKTADIVIDEKLVVGTSALLFEVFNVGNNPELYEDWAKIWGDVPREDGQRWVTRSFSVGDVVELNHDNPETREFHLCLPFGWKKINQAEYETVKALSDMSERSSYCLKLAA